MILILPWPPKELNPNSAGHWRKKAPIRAAYKEACFYAVRGAVLNLPALGATVPLRITFVQPDKALRDVDNMLASIKSGLDGLALALRVDDRIFRPLTLDWERGPAPGAVRVELGPLPC